MSGKSVYLRQAAVAVIMAQMGSFVPARAAEIGIIDRIMTRIGAQDRMARGESTFMVEMRETSAIMRLATPKSLILLDEVGRGTSTFDGISIAWAVVEHLYKPEGGPKVLFATHYFELTTLADEQKTIHNVHLDAMEYGDKIIFLHAVKDGPANQSYGLQVAGLAGVPRSVIEKAKTKLRHLEDNAYIDQQTEKGVNQLDLFSSKEYHPAVHLLEVINPDELSPKQALEVLYRLKALV